MVTILVCNKCGGVVDTTKELVSEGYKGYCPNCDEDLYEIEMTEFEQEDHVEVSAECETFIASCEKCKREKDIYSNLNITKPNGKRIMCCVANGDECRYFNKVIMSAEVGFNVICEYDKCHE